MFILRHRAFRRSPLKQWTLPDIKNRLLKQILNRMPRPTPVQRETFIAKRLFSLNPTIWLPKESFPNVFLYRRRLHADGIGDKGRTVVTPLQESDKRKWGRWSFRLQVIANWQMSQFSQQISLELMSQRTLLMKICSQQTLNRWFYDVLNASVSI